MGGRPQLERERREKGESKWAQPTQGRGEGVGLKEKRRDRMGGLGRFERGKAAREGLGIRNFFLLIFEHFCKGLLNERLLANFATIFHS